MCKSCDNCNVKIWGSVILTLVFLWFSAVLILNMYNYYFAPLAFNDRSVLTNCTVYDHQVNKESGLVCPAQMTALNVGDCIYETYYQGYILVNYMASDLHETGKLPVCMKNASASADVCLKLNWPINTTVSCYYQSNNVTDVYQELKQVESLSNGNFMALYVILGIVVMTGGFMICLACMNRRQRRQNNRRYVRFERTPLKA